VAAECPAHPTPAYNASFPMPFDFDTVTKLIQSPPGQLAAGAVLGGIVWKFFKNVGDVLNDKTNKEIARWLRVKHFETGIVAEEAVNWPDSFAKVFDRVFGEKHLSWKCFFRSGVASYTLVVLVVIYLNSPRYSVSLDDLIILGFVGNVIPDYISLLETRSVLTLMRRTESALVWTIWLAVDFLLTSLIGLLAAHVLLSVMWVGSDPRNWNWSFATIRNHFTDFRQANSARTFFVPAFFTSVWIWLYAASGFTLKAASSFDLGFDWFNRKFDIGKKPLQSIGLVAGALVALLYWTAALIRHFVS
jgi:hypothetical protein